MKKKSIHIQSCLMASVFPLLSTSYLSLSPSSPILPPSSRVGSWTSSNLISHLSIVLAYCLSISSTSLQIKVSHRFWKYRSRRSYCSHIISQPSSWIPLTIGMWAYPLYKSRIQICCCCYYWTQLCVLSPDQTTCLNSLPTYDFLWQNWCKELCSNPMFYFCMKYATIDFHFICDQVQNSAPYVTHVSSKNQQNRYITLRLESSISILRKHISER